MKNPVRGSWRWQLLASALMLGGAIASGHRALAQSNIVPDGTLGAESSVVVPNFNGLPIEAIAGGAQRGQNLFHSFQEFNVSEGRGAYFFSPNATVQNILARVTGTNRSEILGVLGTFGNSPPNVFLINPNGILFGQNAILDVGGSFVASTAKSVVFDNGIEFSATNPQAPPLLTVNVPLGLQTGANPGRIVNQSVFGLEVQPEKTLALVGGEVAIEGGILFAPDGRIELGSVAENSSVKLTPTLTGYALSYEGVESFQDIRLTQEAFVTSRGDSGGSVQVQGRNVMLTDGSLITANVLGDGKGGGLSVNASESVQVIGGSADGRVPSGLFAEANPTATGEAGDLTITTRQLLIRDGAQVSTSTFGAGKGGNVTVNASDSVQVIGRSADGRVPSGLFTGARGNVTGQAGDLRITTSQLLIRDGAVVNASTTGTGKGGNVTVNASDSVQLIGTSADARVPSGLFTQAEGTGDAGELNITTAQLVIQDGARISANTFSSGKGGNVTVNASEKVQLIGTSADGRVVSILGASVQPGSSGKGGNVEINTGTLLAQDGAQVSTDTFGKGDAGDLRVNASNAVQLIGISADARASSGLGASANRGSSGKGGNLEINTGTLLVQDGAQVSTDTFGAGKGGSLTINASDSVQVIGTSVNSQALILSSLGADSRGTGDAGDLTITTSRLLIRDGASVSADTFGSGRGGNLRVNASDFVQVIGESASGRSPSNLSVDTLGAGSAGDLTITTSGLLIRDGAIVSAGTFGAGKGGNVTVNASDFVQAIGESADGRLRSFLTTQTEGTGDAGDLTITTSRLLIRDGAQIAAGTIGSGKGGNLRVNASDSVQLIGESADGVFSSGLFVSAETGSTAGNLTVKTRQMSVRDGALVGVSSLRGQAGNMTITADSLLLNQGLLLAITGTSGAEGGANINLQGLDLLRMDNESLISANALEDANGGNVTIDSTFIVATPPKGPEGSDITANAVRGNGGRVNITTQGLFGIEFRPQRTPKNDITVSSTYGVAGEVAINTPDVDPSRGLAELPTDVVDASEQIDRRCTPAGRTGDRNSFTITGRGGLPPSPNDVLQAESVVVNWVTLDPLSDNGSRNDTSVNPNSSAPATTTPPQTPRITEAQGWVYGSNGEVILTAESPNVTPNSPMLTPVICPSL